jgi:hypothetical protein
MTPKTVMQQFFECPGVRLVLNLVISIIVWLIYMKGKPKDWI